MTKDFRHIGRLPDTNTSIRPAPATPSASLTPAMAQHRKVVLLSIGFAAVLFLLAGLWLIAGGNSPIPKDISLIVGIAFIVSAIADIAAIKLMKRMWAKSDARMIGTPQDPQP